MNLSPAQVDRLNVGLMLVAAAAAFWRPFEVFLFAYAVLGPAHYLTEISWLHDRRCFTKGPRDPWILAAAVVAIALANFLLPPAVNGLVFVAFAASAAFALTTSVSARVATILGAAIAAALLAKSAPFHETFGLFLPTLIHVFLFTALFVLLGALRGRRASAFVSLGVFLALSAGLLFVAPARAAPESATFVRDAYGFVGDDGRVAGGFASLNERLAELLRLHDFRAGTTSLADFVRAANSWIYASPAGLALMSFVAFAYLHHYLNWFSKTSIIRWHEIPRPRAAAIVVLWIASVALYAYDYASGLKWLFLLSFAHVVLEFPLNHLTFVQIGRELGGMLTGTRPAVAAQVRE